MSTKNKDSFRNPQDIIDNTYNARDYRIVHKDMNSYVMPLDMIRDVDHLDPRKFYSDEWNKIIVDSKQKRGDQQ